MSRCNSAAVAGLGLLFEQAMDDVGKAIVKVAAQMQIGPFARENLFEQLRAGRGAERRCTGGNFIQHHAQRV
jgi:hypothetical protein